MPLTERQLRAIRPTDSNLKIFDGGGLYLHVNPKGKKTWRAKLKVNGCEQNLTFGTYPDITLAQARRLSERRGLPMVHIRGCLDPEGGRLQ